MHRETYFIAIVFAFIFFITPAHTQQIWPGDVNGSGKVNGIDLLYLGSAYNQDGPARTGATTNWEQQNISEPWPTDFNDGINLAFADCNGDGTIDDEDLVEAVLSNYGRENELLQDDEFTDGIINIHPSIGFSTEIESTTRGASVNLNMELGDPSLLIENFGGIAFTIRYEKEFIDSETGIDFQLTSNSWMDVNANQSRLIINENPEQGLAEIAITRIDQSPDINGNGDFGVFSFVIEDDIIGFLEVFDTLDIKIEKIRLIDNEFNTIPVASSCLSLRIDNSNDNRVDDCPNVVDPVCGNNGVTYLNPCYALAAGIEDFTRGTCYSGCINPDKINAEGVVCDSQYDPVCGCNNVTYTNACEAERNGVETFMNGPCNTNDCYDPFLIVNSQGVDFNPQTGVITLDCEEEDAPVCGCDGITYSNPCTAEANGVKFYTPGTCEDNCIDPTIMVANVVCSTEYAPVCGCNGETYINACFAEAAGVLDYTAGECNSVAGWCSEAIPIQCGDFLTNETTIGAGNQIDFYPGCLNSTSLVGPDKVYVFNKTTAGDIQIGLEILTPGMDLDIFLLRADCSELYCLASSHTNNSQTNNEGIIFENAPVGTYYLVVDGQYEDSEGDYRLELSCGYLVCEDALPINCNQPVQFTNAGGRDDVSLYSCGNVRNVENNGPEIVHTFTLTESGVVDITLSNLTANLELFLLRSCDRGDCLKFSQNSGTNAEYISKYLNAGIYYVVVDGYNGAVSDYTLLVECGTPACDLSLNVNTIAAGCDENNGQLIVSSAGGTPNFIVSWEGPVSGNFVTNSNTCTIYNLPGGTYRVTKTDGNGCSATQTVIIENSGDLAFSYTVEQAECEATGQVVLHLFNGSAPFTVFASGPMNLNRVSNDDNIFFNGLIAGEYQFLVRDAHGCSSSEIIQVTQNENSIDLAMQSVPASCGELGSIHVEMFSGSPIYTVILDGPVSGSSITDASEYDILYLPGGFYTVTVKDANNCSTTREIVVSSTDLNINAVAMEEVCGQGGTIQVNIDNGTPNYLLQWDGPTSGVIPFSENAYELSNLPDGTYTISVTDGAGCQDFQTLTLNSEDEILQFNTTNVNGTCGNTATVWVDVLNGNAPYTATWNGPVYGATTSFDANFNIPSLPGGNYILTITDQGGCSTSRMIYLNTGNGLNVTTSTYSGNCDGFGDILLNVTGGNAPYNLHWAGPQSGTFSTDGGMDTIPNLPAGTYSITVQSVNGCAFITSATLEGNEGLDFSSITQNGDCGGMGSIDVEITTGTAPYHIVWTGTSSGLVSIEEREYTIENLLAGHYTIEISDSNDCGASTSTNIDNGSQLQFLASPASGACNAPGTISVYYPEEYNQVTINWSGMASGSSQTSDNPYVIEGLEPGAYSIELDIQNGCTATQSVSINSTTLWAIPTVQNGNCDQLASVDLLMSGGSPLYSITWDGPVVGFGSATENEYSLNNLISGDYSISVSDANGCSTTVEVTVNNTNENQQPNAQFSFSEEALTVHFSSIAGASSYFWDFGDNETTTITNPVHQYQQSGNYEVCLTVTNDCGTDTYCENISVTSTPTETVVLNIGELSGAPHTMVAIPVSLQNCDVLVSLAGSLQLSNPNIGSIVGLNPALIAPLYNPDNNTFSYYDVSGQGVPLSNEDVLFYIMIELSGNPGVSSDVLVTNEPLMVEIGGIVDGTPTVLNHEILVGTVSILENVSVAGDVVTWWGEGINNVSVNVHNPDFNQFFVTGSNGEYQIQNIPYGGTYEVRPVKDSDPSNGLSTFGLFQGQRFILGMPADAITSPYQIIAGNANCDNGFTTLDLFIIQQVIIGAQNIFPDCLSWVFVSSNETLPTNFTTHNVFPYQSTETMIIERDTSAHFIGVKVGDILGQANPYNAHDPIEINRNSSELHLMTAEKSVAADEFFELTFASDNFEDMVSLQFALQWDSTKLSYEGFVADSLVNAAAGIPESPTNTLRLSWFDIHGVGLSLTEEAPLFRLQFKTLDSIPQISDYLSLDNTSFQTEAYNTLSENLGIRLSFEEVISTNTLETDLSPYALYQNRPNPFTNETYITFQLPQREWAEIIIFNTRGEQIGKYNNIYPKGQNTLKVSHEDWSSGVYYYTLRTETFTQTRKMSLIK